MLNRFLPLAALMYVSVSLPAHAQAQQGAAGAVRGRIVDSVTGRAVPTATVHLMRNQRVHGTGEADTVGEFSFDHVPEDVYSVEVEEHGYLKAVQADVRVVLRRAAAIEFALVRGSDTAGAGNLTSRGLHLDGPRIHARWAFMATAPSSRSRSS
ncbi:MAG TPA: carboxypeptidase-like regulatory domain-containing protein [Burkholderiaceae bacterium]|nr:carboxypeptidase-like regulatory domain-containing protein [Burkholderiaceae bacterium]